MDISVIVKKYETKKENLLQILHEIQNNNTNHYISDDIIKETARLLNTTYAHVFGVVTYYTMLSNKKRGENIIRVCDSPVCNMLESYNLIDCLEKILKVKCGETTADLKFCLEKVECLGVCDVAPAIMINQKVYGNLNPDKIKLIIDDYRKNENA